MRCRPSTPFDAEEETIAAVRDTSTDFTALDEAANLANHLEQTVAQNGPLCAEEFVGFFSGYLCLLEAKADAGAHVSMTDPGMRRLARLIESAHEDLLARGVDVAAAFEDTAARDAYLAYVERIRFDRSLTDSMVARLRKVRHLYIYGASLTATYVFPELERHDIVADGVIVTSAEGNPQVFLGHRVKCIDEMDELGDDAFVLIATTDNARPAIEALLDEKGWPHAYCWD